MLRQCVYVLLMLFAILGATCGLMCRVCSYNYNPDSPEDDTDCIHRPTIFTGPTHEIHCNRTCIIQENYSLEKQRIVSYLRTCNPREDSGYCTVDTWQRTCFHSCISEFCNDLTTPLHDMYPVRDLEHPHANYFDNYNSAAVSTKGSLTGVLMRVIFVVGTLAHIVT